MRCPECNGRGETIYFVETERDEYSITIEQRQGVCRTCNGSGEKPKTNADRIREMSDEELEAFLIEVDLERAGSPFITEWGKWLKQPAEGE